MRLIKTKSKSKCYMCGIEDNLYYIDFSEFVCLKDKARIDKFLSKIKTKRTRCSVNAYKKRYENGLHEEMQ